MRYTFLHSLLSYFICATLSFVVSKGFCDEKVIVELETTFQPTFISVTMQDVKEAHFSPLYLEKLRDILIFDLNNNGYNQVVDLKEKKSVYQIAIQPTKKDWTVIAIDLKTTRQYKVAEVNLSGVIDIDRRKVHQVADNILFNLFDEKGIATSKILYTVRERRGIRSESWVSEVWMCDYDGSNKKQLTHENRYCVSPTFFPPKEGMRSLNFCYVSYKTGQPKIYLSDFNGKTSQKLLKLRGNQLMPSVSLQRDKIAFISDVTGTPDLFLQHFDPNSGVKGAPKQIYAIGYATQASPTFSPDGQKLAFVSNKGGSPRIYVMDISKEINSFASIQLELISKKQRENSAPCWSYDGQKLAYSARVDGVRQIFVYDFTTKEEIQVTQGPGNKENPSWASNSLHLTFNVSDEEKSDLYIVNLNQRRAVCISDGKQESRFPAWEPLIF